MTGSIARTRPPRGEAADFRRIDAREDLEAWVEDAAHYPGGSTPEVLFPRTEADVAAIVRAGQPLLVVGAQSSLTGGATPRGERVVATARLAGIDTVGVDRVRVGPGVALAELDATLRAAGRSYPPIPTYDGATVGGTVATNAAGAATFKHGSTRAWIEALTIVLADGEVLEIERGQVAASEAGVFVIESSTGRETHVPVPRYRMPDVPKRSAGYHAAAGMDLVDLFVGSEGTLGIVVDVVLRIVSPRPAIFAGFVPMPDDAAALALVADLREASKRVWSGADVDDADVAAVEYMDRRCLELLREDGAPARLGVRLPDTAGAAVLFQAELDASYDRRRAFEELARMDDATADSPLLRVCRILAAHGAFETSTPVLPEETARFEALLGLREAVPETVNRRISERRRSIDASITKSSGDVIVPFDRFEESLQRYREILASHDLDHAIWGHASDGNVHPNVLPRSGADMERARRAQLEIGAVAIELGGCPMSEHGVGRNPVKQELLRRLYGDRGVEEMRAVKRALDPRGILAPGVLFTAESRP
ncbi:MAG: FAD-binding oxidoreductase [Myxococcales bacterium]|nr:MAG: FAD-binding oxidoreductase [Myxococcales bacterium]